MSGQGPSKPNLKFDRSKHRMTRASLNLFSRGSSNAPASPMPLGEMTPAEGTHEGDQSLVAPTGTAAPNPLLGDAAVGVKRSASSDFTANPHEGKAHKVDESQPSTVHQLAAVAQELASTAQKLASTAQQSATFEQLASAVERLTSTVEQHTSKIEQHASTIEQLTSNVERLTSTVEELKRELTSTVEKLKRELTYTVEELKDELAHERERAYKRAKAELLTKLAAAY